MDEAWLLRGRLKGVILVLDGTGGVGCRTGSGFR